MKRGLAAILLGIVATALVWGFNPLGTQYMYDDTGFFTEAELAEINQQLYRAGRALNADVLIYFTEGPLINGTHSGSAKQALKDWEASELGNTETRDAVILYVNLGARRGGFSIERTTGKDSDPFITDLEMAALREGDTRTYLGKAQYYEAALAFAEQTRKISGKYFFRSLWGWIILGILGGALTAGLVWLLSKGPVSAKTMDGEKAAAFKITHNNDRFLSARREVPAAPAPKKKK